MFLYKEDFERFVEGLTETLAHIKTNSPEIEPRQYHERSETPFVDTKQENEIPKTDNSFTDVNFEDLDK